MESRDFHNRQNIAKRRVEIENKKGQDEIREVAKWIGKRET